MSEYRKEVATMVRARNEGRWMKKLLERAFIVSETIVIFDDGSTDAQERACWEFATEKASEKPSSVPTCGPTPSANWLKPEGVATWSVTFPFPLHFEGGGQNAGATLIYVHSPFRPSVRDEVNPNEPRDREFLWEYVKAHTNAKYILCLDGDETLSNNLVRNFPNVVKALKQGVADIILFPFVYLWDFYDQRRVDAWYGDDTDGLPKARFSRMFSVERLTTAQLKLTHFRRTANFLHCGSVPTEYYAPNMDPPTFGVAKGSIIHYGYIEEHMRQTKFAHYNQIDPDNEQEGRYLHIIGKPDGHCPGPVEVVKYLDE